MGDSKRIAALHKQGGVYKLMSEATPGTQDLLDSPTPGWLDREYPYVAPPGKAETLHELDYLVSLIPLREEWASFIRAADEDMAGLFVTLCSELGAPCDEQMLRDLASEASILITKLKWLYNRPRPYQIAAKHGVGFSPVGSKSAHSPAYPSGHTIQANLMASRLSETSPQHRKAFLKLAERVSFSRAVAGYHWPSDLAFGQDIFRHIVMPLMPSAVRVAAGTRVLYHIAKKPAQPKPKRVGHWSQRGQPEPDWVRPWLNSPVQSGVFLTPHPLSVSAHHGVGGHVYAYRVPQWVIKEAQGIHRYDLASEVLIPEPLWKHVAFLGKSEDKDEFYQRVLKTQNEREWGKKPTPRVLRSASRIAKTYSVNKGDLVWYGKYKNQRGKVKSFGMGDKGDPTITLEQLPSPSARKPKKKSPKTLNLFQIRPRKEDEHDKAEEKTASAPKKYEHIDFVPPKGVADAAAKGLELRQKASPSNKGGLTPAEASKQGIGSGVQRAVNLKNHDPVSPKVIKQMRGFLSRSEKSSEISAENRGTPWNDKGYVAWLLWGGDPAKAWTDKVIKQMDAADEKEKQKTAVRLAASKALSKKEVPKADGSGTTTVYEYGPRQVAQRNKEKAVRIESLRKKLGDLRKKARGDLTAKDPETRLTALAVALMDETYERVGNEESAKDGHFGVTNWTADHVTMGSNGAAIKYTGKSGVKQEKKVTDAQVLKALRKALKGKGKGDKILCDGDECDILAKDVNAYLKSYEITAKDIRGLHANEEMKRHLKEQRKAGPSDLPKSRKEKDKILKAEFTAALELAAEAVGHEASTLRSQYLVPSMEASYTQDGTVLDRLDKQATLSDAERDDREAERLIKKAPKKKPPRLDRERRVVKDKDNDLDTDAKQDVKDRSNRSRDASARVALRFLLGDPTIRLAANKRQRKKNEKNRKKNQPPAPKPTPTPAPKPTPTPAPKPTSKEQVPMFNTEADQVVMVSPDTAEAEPSKYKTPSEDQLKAHQEAEKAPAETAPPSEAKPPAETAPAETAPAETAPPESSPAEKRKESAASADAVASARAEIKKLKEDDPSLWKVDELKEALGKEYGAIPGIDAKAVKEILKAAVYREGEADDSGRGRDPKETFITALVKKLNAGPNGKAIKMFAKNTRDQRKEMMDEIESIVGSTLTRSLGDVDATFLANVALELKERKGEVAEDLVTLGRRKGVRTRATAAAKVLESVADKDESKRPDAPDLVSAMLAKRSAELIDDPILLDPTKPLTKASIKPLGSDVLKSKKHKSDMADLTLEQTRKYRNLDKEDREAHRKGLLDLIKTLEHTGAKGSEQQELAIAQQRAVELASAMEDEDSDVNPTFRALLKAAETQGRFNEFAKLNFTGDAGDDIPMQAQYRRLVADVDVEDLADFLPDDHPSKDDVKKVLDLIDPRSVKRELGDADYSSVIGQEGRDMIREDIEDMILSGVMVTDSDLTGKGKGKGKTQKRVKQGPSKGVDIGAFLSSMKAALLKGDPVGIKDVVSDHQSKRTPKKVAMPTGDYDFKPWGGLLSPNFVNLSR